MISLAVEGTQVPFSRDMVYFAFGTGRFRYDCITCQSKCCRGGDGYFGSVVEIQKQVAARPSMRFFVEPCDSVPHFHATNCAPGCFFLRNDGRCQIQSDHGYSAKPSTCRLFPFNDFRRVGPYLVVLPHSGLCPLQLTGPSDRSDCSDHDALMASMELSPIDAHAPHIEAIGQNVHAVIGLERKVMTLAADCAGSGDFVAFAAGQLALQQNLPTTDAVAARRLHEVRSLIHQVLGVESADAPLDPSTTDALIALTPTVRARLLFQAEPSPSHFPLSLDTLPSFLIAFHELLLLARGAGVAGTTYQGAMSLLAGLSALLRMLAVVDQVLVLRPDVVMDTNWPGDAVEQTAYVRILKALTRAAQRREQITLGNAIVAFVPSKGFDRTMFVKRLASRLSGNLTHLDEGVSVRVRLRNPRAALHQWSLRMAAPEDVMDATNRYASRRPLGQSPIVRQQDGPS